MYHANKNCIGVRRKTERTFQWCEVRIEKSIGGSLFGIARLCRVMPDSDPKGTSFQSAPNNHDRFFFLHTFDLQRLILI